MDSKLVKDSVLANLILSTMTVTAKVSDIPGAESNGGNVELDLSKFGDNAAVVEARFEGEIATVTVVDEVATLDFTSAVTSDNVISVDVKLEI